jgi:hypothetical protein
MGKAGRWNYKIGVIGIILMIVTLTCSVNLTNPTQDTTYVTQTFSALGTELAGNLVAEATVEPVTAAETPSAETTTDSRPPVVHSVTPPEPSGHRESGMHDKDNASLASQHRAIGGENFDMNLFERPFTSGVMDYLVYIDIIDAQLERSGEWVLVTIQMSGSNPDGGMKGVYGFEVDNNFDGRGDYIIFAQSPGPEWSSVGVKAYQDTNKDVGGFTVLQYDARPGNGYDKLVFDEGYIGDPDAAWARVPTSNQSVVELAFKYSLINNNDKYLWNVWAGVPEMVNPAWFDMNDHFSHAIAGSPLSELPAYYPLKEFYGWDNTCRWAVGVKQLTGTEKGLCPYTPPAEPTDSNPFIFTNGFQ